MHTDRLTAAAKFAYNTLFQLLDIYNPQMNQYNYLLKFIVIGDNAVGKSCIVLQFIENKTRMTHDVTIGVEFGAKTIHVRDQIIKLQIWDTAGQENFRSITRSYYRSAIGALLVYDITKRDSFEHIRNWLEEVRANGNPHMEILLVGNKNDLENQREVSFDEGEELAAEKGLQFIEISAREYHKVQTAFKKVAESIMNRLRNGSIPLSNGIGIKTTGISDRESLTTNLHDNRTRRYCC